MSGDRGQSQAMLLLLLLYAGCDHSLNLSASKHHLSGSVRSGTVLRPTSTSGKQPQSNEHYDLRLE